MLVSKVPLLEFGNEGGNLHNQGVSPIKIIEQYRIKVRRKVPKYSQNMREQDIDESVKLK
mgnify:CR=1 FL=1